MRVLLDEDVPKQLLEPLRHLVRGKHQIDHVLDVRLGGTKDADLYRRADELHYDALVTNDTNQLSDPAEVRAIALSGLHHISYGMGMGVAGLAHALGALIAALPGCLDELEAASGQRLVKVQGLDPTRKRYELTDPETEEGKPAYWPRRSPKKLRVDNRRRVSRRGYPRN